MKFKKVFIVPVVSLLLLLAYPFSSALASDEDYFHPSGTLGFDELEDSDHLSQLFEDSWLAGNSSQVSYYNNNLASCDYYFTMVDMYPTFYDVFSTQASGTCKFRITYFVTNLDTPIYEDDDYYSIRMVGAMQLECTFSSDFSSYSITSTTLQTTSQRVQFCFNKHSGYYEYITYSNSPNWSASSFSSLRSINNHIFFSDSNLVPLPDGINSGGNGFDVTVSFNPVLQNTVNMYTSDNGVSTLSNYFNMSVRNNGRKSIQFFMAITEPGTNVFTGYQGVYNDYGENVRFVYSSDEWIDQIDEFDVTGVNNTYVSALRRSEWHRVDAKMQVNRNFAWSQMSLQKDHFYDVVVYAMPTREGSTNVSIMHELPAFDWSSCAEVYRSSFKLPVSTKYNASDNSFGNYANSSGDTMSHSNFSAYIDDNGKVQVPGDGKYFTADDIRNRYSQGSASLSSPGSVSSDLNSVASNFHTFFEFINRIFSYFPRGYQAVITAGLTSLIVLGVIKVVLR